MTTTPAPRCGWCSHTLHPDACPGTDILWASPECGMAFPDEYVMLGNKREQVKLAGTAVTPPAARDILSVVADALREAA